MTAIVHHNRSSEAQLGDMTELSYIPSDVLSRLRGLLRPSPIVVFLCTILFSLVNYDAPSKKSSVDMWSVIRKFLCQNDLELKLMFFDISKVPRKRLEACKRQLSSLDELDVIRCGEDASCLYSYLTLTCV
jgi:hypothetical protein